MWMVVVGVLLVGLKLAGFGLVAGWPWWGVLVPFAAAALWWQIADRSGLTRRQAMQREDAKAAKRREAQFESLGLRPPGQGGRKPDGSDRRPPR